MLTAIYTILVFCLIIFIHEFGHFAVSKLCGMTVHEFSIGMGPKLFSHSGKKTLYSVRLLPIGGFVRLEGEDESSDDPNAFCNKKSWQRLLVLAAGAFMNFVLGFCMFIILFSFFGSINSNKVGNIIQDSAFESAGVVVGDEIVRMNGEKYSSNIHNYNDIRYFLDKNGSEAVEFTFKRDGEVFKKTIIPKYDDKLKTKKFGFEPLTEEITLSNILPAAYRQSIFVIKLVVGSFADIISGKISFSNLSGPVGIVNEIGNAAQEGMALGFIYSLMNVLSFAALISINLGVVNLLPLPALDGGRIFFIIIELITGKTIPKEKEGFFHFVGFVLLMVLMISVTFFDIQRLFIK